MPSFIHIITEHNCMTTGRYQLPIILMGDFVQLKQTKNNAILALLWINNENNIDKLIVGNIFWLSDHELIPINTRTTKNKSVNQILDFKRTKFDKVWKTRLCNYSEGLDSARKDTWKFFKVKYTPPTPQTIYIYNYIYSYIFGLVPAKLKIYRGRPTRLNNYTIIDYMKVLEKTQTCSSKKAVTFRIRNRNKYTSKVAKTQGQRAF